MRETTVATRSLDSPVIYHGKLDTTTENAHICNDQNTFVLEALASFGKGSTECRLICYV